MTFPEYHAFSGPPLPSPSQIKLIISDVDGTLLDSHHLLPESNPTYKILRRIRKTHPELPIVVSTGKQFPSTTELRRDLQLGGFPSVHLNGNVTYSPSETAKSGAEVVKAQWLPSEMVRGVYTMLKEKGYGGGGKMGNKAGALFFYDYDTVWQVLGGDDREKESWAEVLRGFGEDVRDMGGERKVEEFLGAVEKGEKRVFKVAFCEEEAGLAVTRKLLETCPWTEEFAVVQALTFCAEMIPKGGNKGTGLEALLRDYYKGSIKPEEVIAFGDGENDVSMFKVAGMSVAMGNAMNEELKRVATWRAGWTNDDGAVGRFLEAVFWPETAGL